MFNTTIFNKLFGNIIIVVFVINQFCFSCIASANAANLIEVDGTTNTQIKKSANNVNIVNIAQPNSGGLSHNKFRNYNVDKSGLIINNATNKAKGVVKTKLGGYILQNPNLQKNSAKVILNEVTSSSKTHLNGYTEIAGSRADIIIANPNGITVNGAGFINTSRLTLIVGSSTQHNPHPQNLNFTLSGDDYFVKNNFLPKFNIIGTGLDVEDNPDIDIVANIMDIVAPIYGGQNSNINLRSGDKNFNYLNKIVTSNNDTENKDVKEIAIDASILGKIQAGNIFIIATKDGFGVKYSADMIATRAGINIDAKGNITYKNAKSNNANINVKSHNGDIIIDGVNEAKNINLIAQNNIINNSQILAFNDVNIDSKADFINKSNKLNLAHNNFNIAANNINNYGQISAKNILKIIGQNNIKNNGEIISAKTLEIAGNDLKNFSKIGSQDLIILSLKNNLSNNGQIISNGKNKLDSSIIIKAKSINNYDDLLSNSSIAISSDELNNHSLSNIIAGNNIDINILKLTNKDALIHAGGVVTISSDKNAQKNHKIFDNNTGKLTSNKAIILNFTNSNIELEGIIKSDGAININAQNINNLTNILAKGDIAIEANNFSNGLKDLDNSQINIISDGNLSISSNQNLNNYATLNSKAELSLISVNGNINNFNGSELIAANSNNSQSAKLKLQASNGLINQLSPNSVIVDGDHEINAFNYVNNGRIDVSGSLIMNITNDLTNSEGSLIFAGNNMNLFIGNNFTNELYATIYANNDLTIQSDEAGNKINKFRNYGNIETYAGNIDIKAKEFLNSRKYDPVSGLLKTNSNCWKNGSKFQCKDRRSSPLKATNHHLYNFKYFDGWGWGQYGRVDRYRATQGKVNNKSRPSVINSGKNLAITVDKFHNNMSHILSKQHINIKTKSFKNTSFSYGKKVIFNVNFDMPGGVIKKGGINVEPGSCQLFGRCYKTSYDFYDFKNYNSLIKAGKSLKIFKNSKLDNSLIKNGSNIDDYARINGSKFRNISEVNNIELANLEKTGIVEFNLDHYFHGPDNQGIFKKSSNPNSPLFETRSQFIDQGKFFGSNYFYQQIGLNLDDVQTSMQQSNSRLIGDQFFQNKIITDQLATIKKNSFLLSDNEIDPQNEIQNLIDNAAKEYTRLGLKENQSLSQTQINNLEHDIIWFESKIIDNKEFIVPKIYLSKKTKSSLNDSNLASKATIYAKDDLEIIANNNIVENSGSIIANNVIINSDSDIINNNFSDIRAVNSINIISNNGSIKNYSQIVSDNEINLSANKDIINASRVATNDINLINENSEIYSSKELFSFNKNEVIKSELIESANISGNNININAKQDFNNYSANINANNNLEINAGDDINITTVKIRNRNEKYWGHKSKGGSEITDKTTNISSNINANNNINFSTNGSGYDNDHEQGLSKSNINIEGSNINANGSVNFNAKDQINITSVLNNDFKEVKTHKITSSSSSNSININDNHLNLSSNINSAKELNMSSGGDINIIASNITGNSSANIIAGYYQNQNPDSINYGEIITNNDAKVNILSGKDSFYSYSKSTKVKTGINGGSLAAGALMAVMAVSAVATGGATLLIMAPAMASGVGVMAASFSKDKMTTGTTSITEKIIASNLNFSDSLTIGSINDLNIKSSNLTTKFGDINLSSNNNINILADSENNSFSQEGSTNGRYGSNKSSSNNINSVTHLASNIIAGSENSQKTKANIIINSDNDILIHGSKLMANDNITINSDNDLYILASTDSIMVQNNNNDESTFAFSNSNNGFYHSLINNSQIIAGTKNQENNPDNINFNVKNNIIVQYRNDKKKELDQDISAINNSELSHDFRNNYELAYISRLDNKQTFYDELSNSQINWDQTSRGLTETGVAAVALAAAAVTIASMGTAAPAMSAAAKIGYVAATAAISTAASTATIAATNASMNADGDLAKQLKSVAKISWDQTTSKDSAKQIATSAVTAAITAGLTQGVDSMTNNALSTSHMANASSSQQFIGSISESAISNIVNNGVNMAVNKESFSKSIKDQAITTLINGVANVATKKVGISYHKNQLSKGSQLILHGAIGCASSMISSSGCASGSVAGIVGEIVGDYAYNDFGLNRTNAIQLASISSGISTIFTSQFNQNDNSQIAKNIFINAKIGANAAENNATLVRRSNLQVIGGDGINDHKVTIISDKEAAELKKYYESLKNSLPESILVYNSYNDEYMLDKNLEIIKIDNNYLSNGKSYDLTRADDFKYLSDMTGLGGVSYHTTDIINYDYNDKYSSSELFNFGNNINQTPIKKINMTNIFFENGMNSNFELALDSANLIKNDTTRNIGLIVNSSLGLANDIIEYIPNRLHLKDVLNGEYYQSIASNSNNNNLVIMHSAGNEDAMKAAKYLKINNASLDNKIDFISVGSPISYNKLKTTLKDVGGNLIGQYNNILDPVTNSKSWAIGASSLFAAGTIIGGYVGSSALIGSSSAMAANPSALAAFMDAGLLATKSLAGGAAGGAAGFGLSKKLINIQHSFDKYYNSNFKGLADDIQNWTRNNPN